MKSGSANRFGDRRKLPSIIHVLGEILLGYFLSEETLAIYHPHHSRLYLPSHTTNHPLIDYPKLNISCKVVYPPPLHRCLSIPFLSHSHHWFPRLAPR